MQHGSVPSTRRSCSEVPAEIARRLGSCSRCGVVTASIEGWAPRTCPEVRPQIRGSSLTRARGNEREKTFNRSIERYHEGQNVKESTAGNCRPKSLCHESWERLFAEGFSHRIGPWLSPVTRACDRCDVVFLSQRTAEGGGPNNIQQLKPNRSKHDR